MKGKKGSNLPALSWRSLSAYPDDERHYKSKTGLKRIKLPIIHLQRIKLSDREDRYEGAK